jgi:hypothetical protein
MKFRKWNPPVRVCVGCGYCCKKATCVMGQEHYRTPWKGTVCPGLYHDGERYRCRLADQYKEALAIGEGCCSPMNSARAAKIQEEQMVTDLPVQAHMRF